MSDFAIKGQPIQASGYLDYDEFKKDNNDYRTAKIVASEVELYAKFDYSERKKEFKRASGRDRQLKLEIA
jgi:hypothetical protein